MILAVREATGPACAGSQTSLARHALNTRWLEEPAVAEAMAGRQGVPDMKAVWIKLHYPDQARGV